MYNHKFAITKTAKIITSQKIEIFKFVLITFCQRKFNFEMMGRAGDFKSSIVFIKGFYHIKATAYVWMYRWCMCIKT